jgi:2-polyprenyl-6-methoxyphenol hydroxylase-like FAD-dependent oxidoreductase
MRQLVFNSTELKELAKLGFVFLGDAAHGMPIVGSEGADYAIQDALDLADVLDDYDIGAFTKEKASAEFEQADPVSSDRLREMILKFYETKLPDEGTSSWQTVVENAENVLDSMHNT